MKEKIKKNSIFIIILIMGFISYSQTDYYPKKNQAQSQVKYDYYLKHLKNEYATKEYFEVGNILSSLYVNSDIVYKYIDKGIRKNNQKCKRIYTFYYLYKEGGFKVNLIKNDSVKFINSFNLCLNLLGENSYEEDLLMKKQKVIQKRLALMKDVDTTQFNFKLISKLKQIYLDDQKYRTKSDILGKGNELIQKKQRKLDSANFKIIDKILLNGYPTAKEIGAKNLYIPWLILQHQTDYKKRFQYIPLLEKALRDSLISYDQLKVYKLRTEKMKLYKTKSRRRKTKSE